MTTAFDPAQGLIIVSAHIWGPTGDARARLALDTGATSTTIRNAILVSVGFDPSAIQQRVRLTTGSGVEFAPRLTLDRIQALGQVRAGLSVIAHTLPLSATVDGLLGLDFLRGCDLRIDFRKGQIILR